MSAFDKKYFQKFEFSPNQVNRYFQNAFRDLEIARKDNFPEVRFTYGYQALIKAGIALLAKMGKVKVRSVPGHHVKILAKMSEILHDPDVNTIGNVMRTKRNADFYCGGETVTDKEADDYFQFVEQVLKQVQKRIDA